MITQLNYAIHYAIKLRRITRVRNFVNYAEILPNYAMGNLLMIKHDNPAGDSAFDVESGKEEVWGRQLDYCPSVLARTHR